MSAHGGGVVPPCVCARVASAERLRKGPAASPAAWGWARRDPCELGPICSPCVSERGSACAKRLALSSGSDEGARHCRADGLRILGELQLAKCVQPPQLAIAGRPEGIARFAARGMVRGYFRALTLRVQACAGCAGASRCTAHRYSPFRGCMSTGGPGGAAAPISGRRRASSPP